MISVIVVNHNKNELLKRCLLSLRGQSYVGFDIIVVDNASVDGSVHAVRKHFPNVDVIENDVNIGFSAANNSGIKKANGEYVVLINPDTLVQEDTFSKLIEFMNNKSGAGGATCKILNPDGTFYGKYRFQSCYNYPALSLKTKKALFQTPIVINHRIICLPRLNVLRLELR